MKKLIQFDLYKYSLEYKLWLDYYIITVLHELSHFVFALPFLLTFQIFALRLTFIRPPMCAKREDGTYNIQSGYAYVSYKSIFGRPHFINGIIASAPLFLSLFIIFFTPYYWGLTIVLLFPDLQPSKGDWKQMYKAYYALKIWTRK